MLVSVVIPAYNEEKSIGLTLESVKGAEKGNFGVELVVLDASSTDNTGQIAKQAGARVVRIPKGSIGYARQQGILNANGEIIVFTDADTTVPKNWLIRHVDVLERDNVVCTYGGFKFTDGVFPVLQFANYIQPILIFIMDKVFGQHIATGQNMAFWKEKALAIGGFDVNIRVMEDTDLAIRMKKVGKVVYLSDLLIYTSGRRSHEGWMYFGRAGRSFFDYFFLGKRNLSGFPDIR